MSESSDMIMAVAPQIILLSKKIHGICSFPTDVSMLVEEIKLLSKYFDKGKRMSSSASSLFNLNFGFLSDHANTG